MCNLKKIILYDLFSGGRNLNLTGQKVKRLLLLDQAAPPGFMAGTFQ